MPDPCCSSPGNDEVFTPATARRQARRWRRRGLLHHERALLGPLLEAGVDGATVLEVGGGLGQLQLALLDAGANRAVNVDLSPAYEAEAGALAAEHGHAERVSRLVGDAAALPDPLPPADVALLHRVVCCTDAWRPMLDAVLAATPGRIALSLPRSGLLVAATLRVDAALRRLGGTTFRMRHHPPAQVVGHLTAAGYRVERDRRRPFWRTVHLVRTAGAVTD